VTNHITVDFLMSKCTIKQLFYPYLLGRRKLLRDRIFYTIALVVSIWYLVNSISLSHSISLFFNWFKEFLGYQNNCFKSLQFWKKSKNCVLGKISSSNSSPTIDHIFYILVYFVLKSMTQRWTWSTKKSLKNSDFGCV